MDDNAGYNQFFMAIEEISKSAFRCRSHIAMFEWIVMTFGLKNAGATYRRAMNYIFHELIGKIVEIYIDDVVVKSWNREGHLANLRKTLECTRKHGLKINLNKCAFAVSAGEFLGFLVHKGGIEVGKKIMEAIDKVAPPTNLTELQSLLGKINFVRRFISNLSERVLPFSPLLKLNKDQEFVWGDTQQKDFDQIKEYMKAPPVLVHPRLDKPFKLYVAASSLTIGSALMQEFEGKERVIAYLSRKMLDPETRYLFAEKHCLCVYYSCTKFQHYLLNAKCVVVSEFGVIKHILSMPILNGRIGKCILALLELDLRYKSAKAVKGQIIADFITQHRDLSIEIISITPWALFVDGSSCSKGGGAGILLISPQGVTFKYAIPIEYYVTNNQAEYEALLRGLRILVEIKAIAIEVFGDSNLVINQLIG